MNDKRFSFIAMCGATRHELHSAYDGCRCTAFEFCSGSLTWRHRTVTSTRQAGRRHFFGGIATNCLNNSKSAPLSPSSSPLRTASSSPLVALFNLAFGKREVLPWKPISASRFCHSRQHIHCTSLAYSARLLRGCSLSLRSAVGGLCRQQQVEYFPCTPYSAIT